MLPGDFDQTADVRELTTYAVVAGVQRDIESVTLDREISNDLPDQVVGGAGVAGGSGTIMWSAQQDVTVAEASPWHRVSNWPPQPGTKIAVYVTDGTTSWPRFTGRIDKTTGTVGGTMRSAIVDYRDQLNVPFTYPAMLAHDIPASSGGPYRFPDLYTWGLISLALRRAGFFNTIPAGDGASISVPMQGTLRTSRGILETVDGRSPGTWPIYHSAPWGHAVGRVSAQYVPHESSRPTISQPVQIALMVAPDHAGTSQIRVFYGTAPDRRIWLRVWSSRRVTVYWDSTAVVELSAAQMQDATVITVLVKGSTWTLRNNAGRTATGTQARSGTERMSHIHVTGDDNARMAGLVVNSPEPHQEFTAINFSPTATFETSTMIRRMDMSPRLENRNLAEFLDDVCQATLTAAWFDESGILRLVPSDNLQSRQPVQELTTLDDITDLAWELSLLNIRHQVNVTYKSASISRTRNARQELYRAGNNTMESGDNVEIFATPGNDEEWFGVDRNPARLDDSNWGWYNNAAQSFIGVHYRNSDGDELSTSGRSTTITVEELGTVSLKITHQAGSYGGAEAHLAVSEDNPVVREAHQGASLPVIRGRAHGTWIDETYTSPTTAELLPDGTTAQELVHDLSYWGGYETARRVGDFLAERVTRMEPTITNLQVTYDPRRQLGDVVTLQLGILDVTLTALIVGISESHAYAEHTQHLTIRVINATSTRTMTYQELAEAWAGRDYNALQAVWANLTYNDLADSTEGV